MLFKLQWAAYGRAIQYYIEKLNAKQIPFRIERVSESYDTVGGTTRTETREYALVELGDIEHLALISKAFDGERVVVDFFFGESRDRYRPELDGDITIYDGYLE